MRNPGLMKDELQEQRAALYNAMRDGTDEQQQVAFNDFAESLQNTMLNRAEGLMKEIGDNYTDERVLVDRGVCKPLTSKERKYFNAAVEHQGFDNLEEVFPETIVVDVFKDLTEEHPLISRIDAKTTSALMKYIYADPTQKTAYWGTIPDDIKQILLKGFKVLSLETNKLSGFVVVTKGFFQLGPNWLATYVTELMKENMAAVLETAIVSGTGKLEPIGMIRKLSGAIDNVYPEKAKIKIKKLDPIDLAGIKAAQAKAKTDNGQSSVVVNPMTYWSKIFPELATRDADGKWHLVALPTGDEIVKSYAVPEDTLIFGVLKNYILAVSGKVELKKYDQTFAVEDLDLYITKMFANGVAKNANAFFVVDISGMTGATIPALEADPTVTKAGKMLNKTDAKTTPGTAG